MTIYKTIKIYYHQLPINSQLKQRTATRRRDLHSALQIRVGNLNTI